MYKSEIYWRVQGDMERQRYIQGLVCSSTAFTFWGLLTLYWKLVGDVSPYLVFCNRVVWSFVFIIVLLAVRKKLPEFLRMIKTPREWLQIIAPAVLISINWLMFIWAVNNDYVIECSLGYFINPLVLTIFGALFFKEKLSIWQLAGIVIAGVGVLIKSLLYGKFPFVGLILAVSFALYGLFKKKSKLSSLNGLAFETLLVGIPSFGFLLFAEFSGGGISAGFPAYYWLLMAGSGVVTAVPLLLYGEGAKRLPLTAVGFLQYIAPILMLVLGIFVFGEPFVAVDIIPFVLIWIGLVFFSYSQYKLLKKDKLKVENA